MTVDVLLADWEAGGTLSFGIGRGHLGSTKVELSKCSGSECEVAGTFTWAGIRAEARNELTVKMSVDDLLAAP